MYVLRGVAIGTSRTSLVPQDAKQIKGKTGRAQSAQFVEVGTVSMV